MIAQFSIRLLCGIALMWCVMPRREVTTGFFRIQMLVALGLSVLTALTVRMLPASEAVAPTLLAATQYGPQLLSILLAVTAFLGSVIWTLQRRSAGDAFVYLVAGLSLALLTGTTLTTADWRTAAGGLHLLSEVSSAALLGAATTGMLLGHWYLTAPTMSIAPLSVLNRNLGIAAALRLVLSAVALAMFTERLAGTNVWIWLSLRWLAGIAGPIVVCLMVWRILKYRNTQAATGVLFVGVVVTFIGETTATLLYREILAPL